MPESCNDTTKLNKIERRIYDELINLRGIKQMNPTKTDTQRNEFLSKFNWNELLLNEDKKARVEHILVKYLSVFTRHHLDIGINTMFKIRLKPQHDKPVYSQSLPTTTNLRNNSSNELALMQEHGSLTTVAFNEYSLPIFAQRKPIGNLRILVALRRINHLIIRRA